MKLLLDATDRNSSVLKVRDINSVSASFYRFKSACLYLLIACFVLSVCNDCIAQSVDEKTPTKTTDKLAKTFFDAKRVAFLGDSITYHGGFLVTLESILLANGHEVPELLNLGLSSETCSGDSEPIHPFPRPNVNERLERLLENVSPDVLVVNYGMNDGIYHPFDETRFENYKRGINQIIESASKADQPPKIILVTPPPFDPLPVRKKGKLVKKNAESFSWKEVYENYDSEVLAIYAQWILKQESRVAACIDLRSPILEDIAKRRQTDPDFHYAHDGVHVNADGHKLIGRLFALALGIEDLKQHPGAVGKLIKQRQTVLRDSWLSEVGHKRPGIKAGLPIKEALAKANELNRQQQALLNENSPNK